MRASNQRNSILGTNTEIFGTLSIDTTNIITANPISITHSNAFSNSAPYGSGSVFISSTAETNNQPLQINAKNTNSSTLGNAVNLVLENYGGTKTASSAYDVDIELIANNELVNAYNGKTELRQSSGRDTGDDRLRDGYFQISPRRGPLHPSGENTGFDPIFWFLPATSKGLGMFETKGNGIVIDPIYNYSSPSKLTLINTFQDTELINRTTASGKYSILENDGDTDSYIRSRSQNGDASVLIQAERGNKNSTLNLRSNWTSGTTGGCFINLLTNVDDTGYRFGVDASGNFYIRRLLAGVVSNVVNISAASSGLAIFTNTADNSQGRIRLSNGSGTQGGGIINYNSNNGIYTFDGNIFVNKTTASTSSSTGALTVAGGVGIGEDLNVGGIVRFTDTTASTSSSTGALVVTGGVGVGGTLDVGYQGDGVPALTFARSDGPAFGSISATGTTFNSILRISNPSNDDGRIDFDSGVNGVYFSFGHSGNSTSSDFSITSSTASTSVSTGALVVDGGVGIGGRLNIGDDTVAGNIRPSATETFDLGSASFEWNNIYAQNAVTVSDRTKKTDIEPCKISVEFLSKLNPVSYNYRSNGNPGIGLIAQDLYTVAEEYALEDYFVNHNNFKDYGIKYNALIPILINAIKELTVRIEKLEA